jgi:hypothetical protein
MRNFLFGVLVIVSMQIKAEQVSRTLTDVHGWYPGKVAKVDKELGVLSITKGNTVYSYHKEKIDPSASYKLSGFFRSPNSIKSCFYFGIIPLDSKSRVISSTSVNIIPGTTTSLLKEAKAGESELLVKDASKWKAKPNAAVAFKVDNSDKMLDLPNNDLSGLGIKKIEKNNAGWLVTLTKPLKKSYPASTAIREHQAGQFAIFAAGYQKMPKKWTEFSLEIKGESLYGLPKNKWRRGTRFGKFVIMPKNRDEQTAVLEFKDITLKKL